jgi:hypothetical protein
MFKKKPYFYRRSVRLLVIAFKKIKFSIDNFVLNRTFTAQTKNNEI